MRRSLPPSRSLSLDTGLDSNTVAARDSETATDVVSSCEQYLQQQQQPGQQEAQQQQQQSGELRPPRRRLSSIPCESSPIAEEESGIEEECSRLSAMGSELGGSKEDTSNLTISSRSTASSRRSSIASTDEAGRKASFVNKCMTRVRGFIKK
nr:uncharacterized protein LOC113811491 [Penaeus vannamei]